MTVRALQPFWTSKKTPAPWASWTRTVGAESSVTIQPVAQ